MCVQLLQSCLTLCNPMDHSPPGSSVHRILQARIILESAAMPFSRIFLTQELNPALLHCRQILYQLSHQGSPLRTVLKGIPSLLPVFRPFDLDWNYVISFLGCYRIFSFLLESILVLNFEDMVSFSSYATWQKLWCDCCLYDTE